MRVSLVMTVVVAGFCLLQEPVHGRPSTTLRDFHRGGGELLIGDNQSLDHNENFFSSALLKGPYAVWTAKLQRMQDEIDSKVVLPQSLVRSFLLVAEKNLMPPPTHSQLDTDRVWTGGRSLIKEAVLLGLFYKKGAENALGSFVDFKRAAEQNMTETVKQFNELTETTNSTMQILVGAPEAAGVSKFIEAYALKTGRPIIKIQLPAFDPSGDKLAFSIQVHAHDRVPPIFVFDKINTLGQADLLRLQVLLESRRLFGNSTVILTFDGTRYEEDFGKQPTPVQYISDAFSAQKNLDVVLALQNIVRDSDSIHFFRQPQSQEYFARIIDQLSPELLHALAVRNEFYASASLPIEHKAVQGLAQAAFDYQTAMGSFPMRRLTDGMFGLKKGKFSCDELFMRANTLEKVQAGEKLEAALTAYKEALEEQVRVKNFFGKKFKIW